MNSPSASLYEAQQKVYPREVVGRFSRLRIIAAWVLLGLYYLNAWWQWNGRQAFLFDLPARKFYVLGLVFWPQDFIFLTGLLVIAALSLFFFTALAGRLWCGYACPQTVWTEVFLWMERVTEGDRAARMKLDEGPWTTAKVVRKSLKQFLWVTFALWTGFTFVGSFSRLNGNETTSILRLSAEGLPDETFKVDERFKYSYTMAVQDDLKVIVGPYSPNGSPGKGIGRLNPDGSFDNTFLTNLAGANWTVTIAVLQRDQKILIGGGFTMVNGVARTRIARLHPDGSLDTHFLSGLSGVEGAIESRYDNSSVNSILVQEDNKVVIGGDFDTVNGMPRSGIARLNADGTLDTNFLANLAGVNRRIHSMALSQDGRILIGGAFTSVNGVARNGIARLNQDGSLDLSFQNVPSLTNSTVFSVLLDSKGRIYAGGDPGKLVRLKPDGTVDDGFHCQVNDTVLCSTFQADGKLVVGGAFDVINGVNVSRVARIWTEAPSYIEKVTNAQDSHLALTLRLPAGTTNRAQYKVNLNDAAWTDLPGDIVVNSEVSTNKLDSTAAGSPQRFYRVKQLP